MGAVDDAGKTHARILQKLDRVIELMEAQAAPMLKVRVPCPVCGTVRAHKGDCPHFIDPVLKRAPCTSCGSLFDHQPGCERAPIQATRESEVTHGG